MLISIIIDIVIIVIIIGQAAGPGSPATCRCSMLY